MFSGPLARSALVLAAICLAGGPAKAEGTMADFTELCTAAVLSRTDLDAARAATGLSRISNQPIAFGWQTATFMGKDTPRTVVVTSQVYPDAERETCVVELDRVLSFEDAAALKTSLEGKSSLGPLDGKIYSSDTGPQGTLKRPGLEPLLTITISSAPERSVLTMDLWQSRS